MIVIVYTRQILNEDVQRMDYTSVNDINEFIEWFFKLGSRFVINLPSKNRILTQSGWESKIASPAIANLQVIDPTHNMMITIKKIVSDEGILFEHIQHCSEQIVAQMALKCVKA